MARYEEVQSLEKVKAWLLFLICCLCGLAGAWVCLMLMAFSPLLQWAMDWVLYAVAYVLVYFRHIFVSPTPWSIVIAIALVLLLAVIGYAIYYYRPKKKDRRRGSKPQPDFYCCVLCFFLGILGNLLFVSKGKSISFMPVTLFVLAVGIAIQLIGTLREVYRKRNSGDYEYFEKNKKKVLVITTLMGMAMVWAFFALPSFFGKLNLWFVSQRDLLEYYAALLSLTFISISVMSMLSDRSVVIYWDNIAEVKLIKPVFASFAAFTYYSIGATIGAGIAAALGNAPAFIVFSLINIATLIILTLNMVDVYYDRESKKNRRVQELRDDWKDYLWVLDVQSGKTSDEDVSWEETQDKHVGYRHYEEKMLLLCQHINRARDEHDMVYLEEVYKLFVENLPCFDTPDGRRVARLLYTDCTAEMWPLAVRSIRDLLDRMEEDQPLTEDPFAEAARDYRWDQDSLLWQCLMDAGELAAWVRKADEDPLDNRELKEFMLLLIRRLVILYNDMVAHSNYPDVVRQEEPESERSVLKSLFVRRKKEEVSPEPSAEYKRLVAVWRYGHISVVTETEEKPDRTQICQVYDNSLGEEMSAAVLPARLLAVMTVVLRSMDEDSCHRLQMYLADLPLPNLMMAYENMYQPGSPEMALWQTYFPAEEK